MESDIFLFFLNQQIEREISFRTESGLYFSYYKQIVLAPSLSQGKQNLLVTIVLTLRKLILILIELDN